MEWEKKEKGKGRKRKKSNGEKAARSGEFRKRKWGQGRQKAEEAPSLSDGKKKKSGGNYPFE